MNFIAKPIEHSINFDPSEYDAVYDRLVKILVHQEVTHRLINKNIFEYKKMSRPTMHETIIFGLGDGQIEIDPNGILKINSTNSLFRMIHIIIWIVCVSIGLPIFILPISIIGMIISDGLDALALIPIAFLAILLPLLLIIILPGLICTYGMNKKSTFAAHTFLKYLTRVSI